MGRARTVDCSSAGYPDGVVPDSPRSLNHATSASVASRTSHHFGTSSQFVWKRSIVPTVAPLRSSTTVYDHPK